MKIVNKSVHRIDIPLIVQDTDGSSVDLTLKFGQITFTPTNTKTRTINLHGAKRNIGVSFEDEKPEHLEYFETYYEDDLIPKESPAVDTKEEVVEKAVQPAQSLQDMMDFGSKVKDIDTEDKSELLFEKSKEAIGADEDQLYSELDLNAIKESVDEKTETPKPKPKRKSRKGPGRPKKRGPKPKKKAPGRPAGSKNKKK